MWHATLSATPNFSLNGSYPAVEGLETDPLSGRVVPEVGDDTVREVIHGNYRIVYRVRPDLVEIVTVFHGARLFRLR
jgi:toxin ParE1/3/4